MTVRPDEELPNGGFDKSKPIVRFHQSALRPPPTQSQHEIGAAFYLGLLCTVLEALVDGGEINRGFTGKITLDVARGEAKHLHIERRMI